MVEALDNLEELKGQDDEDFTLEPVELLRAESRM